MKKNNDKYDGAERLTPGELDSALRGHDRAECMCSGCHLWRDQQFAQPKHTPGPWVADENEVKVKDGMWMSVCTVNGSETDALNNANAALIAAAPELFGALKSVLAQIDARPDGESHIVTAAARAVIAKAEGNKTRPDFCPDCGGTATWHLCPAGDA